MVRSGKDRRGQRWSVDLLGSSEVKGERGKNTRGLLAPCVLLKEEWLD